MGRTAEPAEQAEPRGSPTTRKRLRRIPDEFRKRTAQSCDLCRKRRCRCIPADDGRGCVTCQNHKATCSYNLPRKTRFYGSVDDLSDRYKCLEAIVKAAFPDEPTASAEDLLHLGRKHGFPMPDLAQEDPTGLQELVRDDTTAPAPMPGSEQEQAMDIDNSQPSSQFNETADEPVSLIRDTSGREHYIGPGGSIQFWGQLRRLLISYERSQAGDGPGHASKLVQDNTALALESDVINEDATDTSAQIHPTLNQLSYESPGSINSSIAKDFTRQSYEEAEEFLAQLPSQQVLDPLIQSFFKHVHEDFPLFHRGQFEEEYESYLSRARQRTQRSRPGPDNILPADSGWLGCLQMMIVLGSMSNPTIPGVDHAALRKKCVTGTRNLLPWFVSKCSLSNVRALLLLSLFLHNNNERNAAWNLVGTATRISFALGLHREDIVNRLRPMEREVRKRVFCTLYGFEQFLSSLLGRPSGLNDFDVEVVYPREGLLGGGQDGDDQLTRLTLQLHQLLSKVRRCSQTSIVRLQQPRGSAVAHEGPVKELLEKLRAWKKEVAAQPSLNIPSIAERDDALQEYDSKPMGHEELRTLLVWQNRSRLRATLLLHIQYRYASILLTRAFLLREVALAREHQVPPHTEPETPLSSVCLMHACQLARLVLLLDSFGLVNGISGLDVFYSFSAAMVLILRLVHQPNPGSQDEDKKDAELAGPEARLRQMLRELIARLREAVLRVGKSGTMKRVTQVMVLFEECVSGNHTITPSQTSVSVAGELKGARLGSRHRPALDERPTGVTGASLQHGVDAAASHNFAPLPGNPWPPNEAGALDGFSDFNMWMDQVVGSLDGGEVWGWDSVNPAPGSSHQQY
ncbi:hypothetical protein GQ53DRAFT_20306 [Thozetella sp. PMI_491]|nr:hypothetical protein GQ53DRAFT_20306 [Thozetella sp. PMI_491]